MKIPKIKTWSLFLDFDGVLNNEPFLRLEKNHPPPKGARLFAPDNITALNSLCRALPVSSIVITSSWRKGRSLDSLGELLRNGGFDSSHLVYAVTGHIADDPRGRAAEIASYRAKHNLNASLVLDDFDLAPYGTEQFFQIDKNRGLTDDIVNSLVMEVAENT